MPGRHPAAAVAAIVGLAVFLVGCAAPVRVAEPAATPVGQRWQLSDDLEVSAVAPGVWLHTTWRTFSSGVRFPSNGLIVRDGDALLLVDTAWGVEPTRALLAWADATLGLPVDRAIVTHFHDDRYGGAPVLRERRVAIEMHRLTQALANVAASDVSRVHDLSVGQAVRIGGVEVVYPGPAHTRDNVAVWIPSVRLLFGGCAIRPAQSTSLGNVADADIDAWPNSVMLLRQRYPNAAIVIPSHGAPGDLALLDHTLNLFD